MSASAIGSEATLRQLEIRILRTLDGILHGDHLGLVPGVGSEHGEGRRYQPGDDVRRIDWNLTARTDHPHVRDTIADRELQTWVVADGSASLDFGSEELEKRDLVLAATAAFAFLTTRAGNRLGAVLFDAHELTVVRPQAGREAAYALLHRLRRRPRAGAGRADLGAALHRLGALAVRRGLVVVVTDLLDDGGWEAPLRRLALRHDVVVVRVTDPRETELPPVGLVRFVDPETGRVHTVQTSHDHVRDRFAAGVAEQRRRAAARVRRSGVDLLELSTDRDWLLDIARFAATRRRRR